MRDVPVMRGGEPSALLHSEDQALIERLYQEHAPSLLRYLKRMLRSDTEAEDVLQDVFVRICRRGDPQTLLAPGPVLFKAAFRLALNRLRGARTSAIDGAALLDDLSIADAGPSQEDQLIAKMELSAYCDAIQTLPPQCRRVVTMREIYGFSYKEISDELGLSISTLEKHVVKGKRLCQSLFNTRHNAANAPAEAMLVA